MHAVYVSKKFRSSRPGSGCSQPPFYVKIKNVMKCLLKNGITTTIEPLYRRPEHIDTVSKWIYDAFIRDTPRTVSYDTVAMLLHSVRPDRLPMAFIAISDTQVDGFVLLVKNDLKTQSKLSPWLASLYVAPPFRSLGIAGHLIKRVCLAAGELGYEQLYLRTEHTADYYRRNGWTFLHEAMDEYGIKTDIFSCLLNRGERLP